MRRFFAAPESFDNSKIALNVEESKHLRDVLRLRESEKVAVFDGTGNEFLCAIENVGGKNAAATLVIIEKIDAVALESNLDLTLAVALLKGEKFDLVIQKAVELGVKRIVPLITKRSDVKINDAKDIDKKLERWRRIALEACKQSGRAFVPEIIAPQKFDVFLPTIEPNEIRFFFAERGGENLMQSFALGASSKLTAIVGAEGGWDNGEVENAAQNGCRIVTVGRRILRAETAAIAVCVLLQHLGGDLR